MTTAAIAGNVALRAFQLGLETTLNTPVAATRRMPWSFAPTVNPNWTWPTAQTGTLDHAIPPYRTAFDVTGQATGQLAFNDIPFLYSATIMGGISPTGAGAAKTWTYQPASTSQDVFDLWTGQWGDDTTDQFQYVSGVVNQLVLTYPEDLGPITIAADYRFSNANYPVARTPGLQVDLSPNYAYNADTSLYIDNTAGGIEATQILNTMHGATVTINNNIDPKRSANGSNARYQVFGYGRGARTFEVSFNFAKSTAALTEVANWLTATATERFVGLKTVSVVDAEAGLTKYSHDLRFSGFWFTRSEGTYGTSNATVQLVCQGFLDQTLTYPFKAVVVNTLASLS